MPLLKQVLEQYPKTVKLAFKNFPLRNHQFAFMAAVAAMAAESQGKFWEFHDLLFKDFDKLNDRKFTEIAGALNLDQSAWQEKMKDPRISDLIRQDFTEGVKSGVRGTPSVFINGRLLKNRSMAGFRAMIDKELNSKNRKE